MSIVVSITGGIGTGKTAIAEIIRNEGFDVISSDTNAAELMANNSELREKLSGETGFGSQAFLPDGSVNKTYLSSLIFGDGKKSQANLEKLNLIVHPYVIDEMIESVQQLEAEGKPLIFVESALTFEANLDDGFDYIIVADAPEELCIQRVMERSGMNHEEVLLRINTQMPQKEKVSYADFVITNTSSPEDLKKSVLIVLNILRELEE